MSTHARPNPCSQFVISPSFARLPLAAPMHCSISIYLSRNITNLREAGVFVFFGRKSRASANSCPAWRISFPLRPTLPSVTEPRPGIAILSRHPVAPMQRIRQHGNLPIEPVHYRRQFLRPCRRRPHFPSPQCATMSAALTRRPCPPRARQGSTHCDVECDLQTQPLGLFQSVNIKRRPLRTAELRASGHTVIAVLVRPFASTSSTPP